MLKKHYKITEDYGLTFILNDQHGCMQLLWDDGKWPERLTPELKHVIYAAGEDFKNEIMLRELEAGYAH